MCIHGGTAAQSELESEGNDESGGTRTLTMAHFQEALKANSPTITRNAMKEIERLAEKFDHQSVESIRAYFDPKKATCTNRPSSTPVANQLLGLNDQIDKQGKVDSSAFTFGEGEPNVLNFNTEMTIDKPASEPPVVTPIGGDNANIELGPSPSSTLYQPLSRDPPEI